MGLMSRSANLCLDSIRIAVLKTNKADWRFKMEAKIIPALLLTATFAGHKSSHVLIWFKFFTPSTSYLYSSTGFEAISPKWSTAFNNNLSTRGSTGLKWWYCGDAALDTLWRSTQRRSSFRSCRASLHITLAVQWVYVGYESLGVGEDHSTKWAGVGIFGIRFHALPGMLWSRLLIFSSLSIIQLGWLFYSLCCCNVCRRRFSWFSSILLSIPPAPCSPTVMLIWKAVSQACLLVAP